MRLELNDHSDLHAGVLHGVLAGGAAGLLNLLFAAPFGLVAAAFVLAAGVLVPRKKSGWASLAVLAAVAAGVVTAVPAGGWWVAAVAGVAWTIGRPNRSVSTYLTAGLGVLGALAARLVVGAMATRAPFIELPVGMVALCEGMAAGLLMGVAAIGRHLTEAGTALAPAPVLATSQLASGEIGQLLRRAAVAHREAVGLLGPATEPVRIAADQLMSKLQQLGAHWQKMESATAGIDRHELVVRASSLRKRAEAEADPIARADFNRASDAVEAQGASLREIARGRDRAVARLSREVALLERLRLTTLHHQSTDGARLAGELAPLADELLSAGQELTLAAESMAELGADDFALETPALPPHPAT